MITHERDGVGFAHGLAMSLRFRLLVVASLAVIALITASVAIRHLVDDRDSLTITEAERSSAATLRALADAYASAPALAAAPRATARVALRATAREVLTPVIDTRGGYCWTDGDFVEELSGSMRDHGPGGRGGPPSGAPPGGGPEDRGRPGGGPPGGGPPGGGPPGGGPPGGGPPGGGPPGGGPPSGGLPPRGSPPRGGDGEPPGPPHEIRQALASVCARAKLGAVDRQRVALRDGLVALAVQSVGGGVSAFTMRLVVAGPAARGWPASLAMLSLVTLAMIVVTFDALFVLRRGARDLGTTLVRLEADLRAEPPRPRTRELAEVASGVEAMARRLADARDRERTLEHRVAHQRRLSSLGHLVAGIAHEVRNPLTGIKLLLDGMRRRSLDQRTQVDVETALREIARLDKLVRSLLLVARDASTEPAVVDLAGVADERIAAISEAAAEHGVALVRRGGGELRADRDAIVRILDNLLRNAIDASPPGAPIEVAIDVAGTRATIDVVDRGAGVSPAQLANLFEPFVTSKREGTGLGLWLSLALAESRGGTVRYRRDATMTHFTLELVGAA